MADTEREAFEAMIVPAWSRETYVDGDGDVQYVEDWMQGAWMGWSMARAALASCPAEVDDEGLPAPAAWAVGKELFTCHDAIPFRLLPPIGQPEPLFTAEQYRQGQRDAVAAYKRQQVALQQLADQAQELDMGYGAAPSHTTNKEK